MKNSDQTSCERHNLKRLDVGVVVIGRNEGERLTRCFESLSNSAAQVYVDSGSTDGSVEVARARQIKVVELDLATPFTAARARNAGLAALLESWPSQRYVQFVDADCELSAAWMKTARQFLDSESQVAAVCGRLRERFPERSVYNWLCDKEWDRPIGEVRSCAGNVMMRVAAFITVGGYREDVIAAEEDELCVRLRRAGWRIWRLDDDMALHDAAMFHFAQWWRRSVRAGYAFAQGNYLHGAGPERHFAWEVRRAFVWGTLLPLTCLTTTLVFPQYGWIAWLVYPAQLLRLFGKSTGSFRDRASLAWFQLLARLPEAVGLARFWRDRLLNRRPRLIEHKQIT